MSRAEKGKYGSISRFSVQPLSIKVRWQGKMPFGFLLARLFSYWPGFRSDEAPLLPNDGAANPLKFAILSGGASMVVSVR
jgi:hypothetical protein